MIQREVLSTVFTILHNKYYTIAFPLKISILLIPTIVNILLIITLYFEVPSTTQYFGTIKSDQFIRSPPSPPKSVNPVADFCNGVSPTANTISSSSCLSLAEGKCWKVKWQFNWLKTLLQAISLFPYSNTTNLIGENYFKLCCKSWELVIRWRLSAILGLLSLIDYSISLILCWLLLSNGFCCTPCGSSKKVVIKIGF